MQEVRASVWLVARRVLPEQRCGVGCRVDPRARPAPPSSRGGAAGKARPLVRLVGCCPLKGSLQCGKGERRRGSVWSLSVFSLGIFRPFLGLFHGFLSSMMSIFARLLLWWKRWSIYLRGKINNQVYLTSMRVLTLAVTPANSTTFWSTIYSYTASATAGNLSYDCARLRYCTVSAAASPEGDAP